MLYEKYTESIRDYLKDNIIPELRQLKGPELLTKLNKKWQDHEIMVKWMQRFFAYLDKFYVEMHSIAKLSDQGFKIFKEVVFNPICDEVTKAIVDITRAQREGQEEHDVMTQSQMLRDTVKIYLRLSQDKLASDGFMPRVQLDKNLVEETRKFYANKAMTMVDSMSLVDYLKETARAY